jgi:hypothetical protein
VAQTRTEVTSKFQRYRRSKQLKGMRLLRLWVPDPHSPSFRKLVRHAIAVLRKAPEQAEATRFIETAVDWSY